MSFWIFSGRWGVCFEAEKFTYFGGSKLWGFLGGQGFAIRVSEFTIDRVEGVWGKALGL